MNKDFYEELPGMVCAILDDLIEKYGDKQWFNQAWEEYRQHIKDNSMDDMKMPGYVFNKYIDNKKQQELKMNREIKFRGYLKDSFFKEKEKHPSYEPLLDKRIVKIHSIHFNSKKVIISCPTGGNMSVEFKDIEIMQCTGLKDKNGKEIYDGDLIRYKNGGIEEIDEVFFDKEYGTFEIAFNRNKSNSATLGFWIADLDEESSYEIIGNIYESEVEDVKD